MKQPARIFTGRIKDGKFLANDNSTWIGEIRRLEGQEVEINIGKRRMARSLSANAYYWGVVIALLAEHCGYETEEMHEALKWKFLRVHDEQFETVKSTASLNTAQFAEYVDCCIRLAAELGVVIPEAEQVA